MPVGEIAQTSVPEPAVAAPPESPEPAAIALAAPVLAAPTFAAEPDVVPLSEPATIAAPPPPPEYMRGHAPPAAPPAARHAVARAKPRDARSSVPVANRDEPPLAREVAALRPTAPAPAVATAAGASWRSAVAAWLVAHRRYPEAARQGGEEGAVGVLFTVERDGRVASVAVARPSGSAALDKAVREMLEGQRVPPFPPEMAHSEAEVMVTIRYRLDR